MWGNNTFIATAGKEIRFFKQIEVFFLSPNKSHELLQNNQYAYYNRNEYVQSHDLLPETVKPELSKVGRSSSSNLSSLEE